MPLNKSPEPTPIPNRGVASRQVGDSRRESAVAQFGRQDGF
jgi:hypothetical protein